MKRGDLFARIEHIERGLERPKRPGAAEPSPPPRERTERPSRPVLTASPAALATAAQRARRTRPPTVVIPPGPNPKGAVRLVAKALKVTLALDATALGQIELPQGKAAPAFVITAGDCKVTARVPAKALKKVLGLIAEHGADGVAVILQGKLAAGTVIADLVAQVRIPKPAAEPPP